MLKNIIEISEYEKEKDLEISGYLITVSLEIGQ